MIAFSGSPGQTRHGLFLGGGLWLCLGVITYVIEQILPAVGIMSDIGDLAVRGLAALTYLAGAYTINAALARFIWFGTLREGDHSRVPTIIIGLSSLSLYACTGLLILSRHFDQDVTAVAATSGVLAIVLGYSAQSTLSEVFSGLALNISRPFRTGDSIQVDGIWGVVVESGWRSVTIRTYEGTLVVLPNSKAASQRLTNLDLPTHQLRHHIPFTIDAAIPPGRVQSVGLATLEGLPHVLASPPPMILLKNITELGIAYEAIFWHDDPNVYILRRDEVGAALWYGFHRAEIPFAINRRLQIPDGIAAPGSPATDQTRYRAILRHLLHHSTLYQTFPEAARDALSETQPIRFYAPHERLIRQGRQEASMFLILEGTVDVLTEEGDSEKKLYSLGAGETFGHMSLMTGAPRYATVRATSHLVVAEIDKTALAPLLKSYPSAIAGVAQEIMTLEDTKAAILKQSQTTAEDGADTRHTGLEHLVDRIRTFFDSHHSSSRQ